MTGNRFLLIGGDSEIARATAAHVRERGSAALSTTRRSDTVGPHRVFLDLVEPLDDWRSPPAISAACIFAAIGNIPDCARDPSGSAFINTIQTVRLADRLVAGGIPALFLSTDKVFDGSRPQMPADTPLCPLTEYGRQKAATEQALNERIAAGAPITILRFAKIVSPGMALLRGWCEALAAGIPVHPFFDLVMAPTPVALAAAAVAGLLAGQQRGIFQLSGPRDVTYAEVAYDLARRLGAPAALVDPVSAHSAGLPPGSTPAHTTLDSGKVRDALGISVADPWEVVADLSPSCLPPAR